MGQDQPGGSGVWKPMGGESAKQRIEGDEDVEGHKFQPSSAKQRADGGDDEDVEGHAKQR